MHRVPLRCLVLALSLALTPTLASRAAAQEAQSHDDERARLHFEAGRAYFEEGSYEQALTEFTRAYELSHRSVLLVNIANVEERLAHYAQAADALETFLSTDALAAEDPERITIQRRITNLRERAARAAAETPPPDITPPPDTTPPPPPRSSEPPLLVPSLVAFGVGGASLIAWGILGGLALAEQGSVSSGCGATRSCTPDQVRAMDDLALGADIAMVIGLVGVAAGTVLILIPASGPSEQPTSTAMITPFTDGRTTIGLSALGSF